MMHFIYLYITCVKVPASTVHCLKKLKNDGMKTDSMKTVEHPMLASNKLEISFEDFSL